MMRFSQKVDGVTELVLLDMRHAEEMFELVKKNRDHLGPWLPWVDDEATLSEAKGFVREMLYKFASGTDLVVAVSYKGQLAGALGLHDINTRIGSAEIGYWLGVEFEGKGLVTKACVAVLDYAFEELGLNRVQIRVEPANTRSRGVPRRLGFHYEGTLRQVGRVRERLTDLEVYSMLKSEWRARRPESAV